MRKRHEILFLIILTACSSSEKDGQQSINNYSDTIVKINRKEFYSIDQQPAKTIIDFLKWYKINRNRLVGIETVKNVPNSENYDSTKFYSVNFEGTEKYLSELKRSGFISDKYIGSWREYFKKCDENFKINPRNDGPAEGFDFDFITWTQEYEETLANINKTKVLNEQIINDKAMLVIDLYGMKLGYWLTKINDKWIIDKNIEVK